MQAQVTQAQHVIGSETLQSDRPRLGRSGHQTDPRLSVTPVTLIVQSVTTTEAIIGLDPDASRCALAADTLAVNGPCSVTRQPPASCPPIGATRTSQPAQSRR